MKVLVTATTFPRWKNDKVPYFIYDLSQEYKKNGIDVVVLAPHYAKAKFMETLDGLKIYRFPYFFPINLQRICYDGGILDNLKHSLLAKLEVPLFLIMDLAAMIYVVKKEEIDVIHSHWIISQGLIASLVSKILNTRHVLTMHAGDIALLNKLPLKKKLASFILNNTDKITVVSSHGLQRFMNLFDNKEKVSVKTSILPMGIDLKKYHVAMNKTELRSKYSIKERNVLLFIGRLSEKKGVKNLVEALPGILSKYPDSKLIVLGDGPEKEGLISLSNNLNLSNQILFKGFVTGDEKIEYLHLSDILIVPSIQTKIGDAEGLPVVILEGLASGIGVIATQTGGIPEIIEDEVNGKIITDSYPTTIKKSVVEILDDKKLLQKYIKNTDNMIWNYDWSVIGQKYTELINYAQKN